MRYNKKIIHYAQNINGINLFYPKIDLIINNINNSKYFTFSKISTEWWKTFNLALKKEGYKNIKSKNFSLSMLEMWNKKQKGGRNWHVSWEVFYTVINSITKSLPKNFILGITDRTPGKKFFISKKHIYPDRGSSRDASITKTIKSIIPKKTKIFDAMGWKYWGISGEFSKIIEIINKKNISTILIGPNNLNNFGKICKIKNFRHFNIHNSDAALYVKEYYKQLINLDRTIFNEKVYLLQGGAACSYLSITLHNKLRNAFIFDVGKGLDFYQEYAKNTKI